MVRSKKKPKKGVPKKEKPKLTKKQKLWRTRQRWVRKQLAESEDLYSKRLIAYINCPISDTKRFPRVRAMLEEARLAVARWKSDLFRLEQLLKYGKCKELD